MLQLINGADNPILNVDDFYITEKWSGLDELVFTISIHDPAYPAILEEALIQYEQPYLIKAIDAGAETAKVICQIDLDAWKAGMLLDYTNGSNTAYATISSITPAGWHVNDHSGSVRRRTIEGEAYTPLEVVEACPDVYDVVIRFDAKNKILHLYDPEQFQPLGAFASRELNLTEINYKGKSSEFATRLYAVGKDGMTFAGINGGKTYIEDHTYSDKIISAYWKDERYTDPKSLLDDARKSLKQMAVPVRSYACSIVDLAATNPELYSFQDFSLFSIVRLIDDIKETALDHQVVEYKRYPYHPEKNEVTLSTVAPSVTSTVKGIKAQIEKPTSGFRQQIQILLDSMASAIAGYDGGNLVITQNADGKPNGIMIMDTDSKATAKKVLWMNLKGITYSHNGADGPWDTVWSFAEGGFIADFIVAGILKGIIIQSQTEKSALEISGANVRYMYNGKEYGGTGPYGAPGKKPEEITIADMTLGIYADEKSNGVAIYAKDSDGSGLFYPIARFKCEEGDAEKTYSAFYNKQFFYGEEYFNGGSQFNGAVDFRNKVDFNNYINLIYAMRWYKPDGTFCGKLGIAGANGDIILAGVNRRNKVALGYTDNETAGNEGIVEASTAWTDYRARVNGGLRITGNMAATGTKNRIVDIGDRKILMNAYETADCLFGDCGSGIFDQKGELAVNLDKTFRKTIEGDYNLFAYGYSGPVTVKEKTESGFILAGQPGSRVDYEIKAKQKGYADCRMREFVDEEEVE